MVPSTIVSLLDLPLEALTGVCQQLDLRALLRAAQTCKRVRHGDGGPDTLELPTKSPVVTALREHAFPGGSLIPSTRPIGRSESWVAYLARCARQRCCLEAPPIAAGVLQSLFLDAAGRLLTCGEGTAAGHGDGSTYSDPTPVATMAGIRVRSVAAGSGHSLALGWDGGVYSWGKNPSGQLGHGDTLDRPSPALVEGLAGMCGIASCLDRNLAVTRVGVVFRWGRSLDPGSENEPRPVTVEGLGGVSVRRAFMGWFTAFAIGEDGELFSWGRGDRGTLGHGDTQDQALPKRVEALRSVRVRSVSVEMFHALALAEDGLVYASGENRRRALLGNPNVESELLPRPVAALGGVRVGSVTAGVNCSYVVADTGELWAWGCDGGNFSPLGHGEQAHCPLPKPVDSLRGIKVDAVSARVNHTLALAEDGSVYAWGTGFAARTGVLGLGPGVTEAGQLVPTPQRVPALRVACGL